MVMVRESEPSGREMKMVAGVLVPESFVKIMSLILPSVGSVNLADDGR